MNPSSQRYLQVRRTTMISGATNFCLALLKCIIGWLGHSSALVADGLHSFSDLLTDGLVLIAAKAGMKKPDADHPYGHQRIETVITTLIASLLIAVGMALAYNTALDFMHPGAPQIISKQVIFIAILSIIANEWLYRYSMRISQRVQSPLLESNAWHHRSDALGSIVVLFSVIGSMAGIHWLDLAGALIIAGFIVKMGAKMIWDSLRELIDTAVDPATLELIKQEAQQTPGVVAMHQIRSRTLAGQIYLDLHLIVDSHISVSEGHHIAEQVESKLVQSNPNIHDVTVHIDAEDDETNSPCAHLPSRQRLIQELTPLWDKLPTFKAIKHLRLHYLNGCIEIEIYFADQDPAQLSALAAQYHTACASIPAVCKITCFLQAA